ncbi:MAG: hypothetical protein ABJL67_09840 [Sulfitobacter sp.]
MRTLLYASPDYYVAYGKFRRNSPIKGAYREISYARAPRANKMAQVLNVFVQIGWFGG